MGYVENNDSNNKYCQPNALKATSVSTIQQDDHHIPACIIFFFLLLIKDLQK